MDDQYERLLAHQRDGLEHGHRIEAELVKTGIRAVAAGYEEQRITVGRRFRREVGADVSPRARPIVDEHLLLEALSELRSNGACRNVRASAGGERNDQPHRTARIFVLCVSRSRYTCTQRSGN